ncbi:hypothetical protein GCM10007938_18580 [Vibrio zhanjiangensis]|uniref:Peptidase S54 rhomboid domain-containing protein n=2 Tax=Vibrio zhanjiangensis TaxID=1046128 RepID=A0ABQ6EZZ9_9VIBR|nr:hypothetical protein GCM10007938_18580 [Vibrio zhanjiangensis]
MYLFILTLIVYVSSLTLIKPAPSSLKSCQNYSYSDNFKRVWASIFSGALIILVFFLTTNFGFISIDENLYKTLALKNNMALFLDWPAQLVSHLFIHGNLIHLVSNVVGLGMASVYERRVGAKRYFSVLLIGSLASIPSVLFYSENVFIGGISGGVFGLAAAYFTDEKDLTLKEWLLAIALFLVLAALLAFDSENKINSQDELNIQIDHIGHFLGALGAILYCRFVPLR